MKSVDIDSVASGWTTPPVVVVGAGASGLTAVKCCLEEKLNVVCFEKTDYVGGLWRYKEEVVAGVASVMKTTVINSCKELSAYSDFPPPPEYANFMHNRDQVKYFDHYADKFDLRKHIYLYYVVDSVVQNDDFESTGQWTVTVTNTETNKQSRLVASAVMICTGHHSYPHIPPFPGLDKFKGKVIHTHSYKDHKPFDDQRVVIVGIGNSGGDIAVELGRASSKVYLSTRRGTWIINRVGVRGMPTDYLTLRRFLSGPNAVIPQSVVTYFAEKLHQQRFDHELYNLKPSHSFFSQHPMVNDSLPNSILCGTVVIKNDIHHFTEDGVVFKGEVDNVYPVDAVILATGYDIHYPFLDSKIFPVKDNVVHLYKYVFQPKIQPPTLSIIGLIQPYGSIVPISEMQSRWAVSILKKKTKLPSIKDMEEDIKKLQDEMTNRYVNSRRHTVQVDYMSYMDDIGEIGRAHV